MTNFSGKYITNSSEETKKIAENFAKKLKGGDIVALYGELGSGKTTFVQGLAKGLGIKKRIISPTFIIVRSYKIEFKSQSVRQAQDKNSRVNPFDKLRTRIQESKVFNHIDLYRIEGTKDIEGLGLDEIINDPQNIVAIEWAEKLEKLLPRKRIDVKFNYLSKNKRHIEIKIL